MSKVSFNIDDLLYYLTVNKSTFESYPLVQRRQINLIMDHQFRSKQYQLMVVIKIYVQHLGFHGTSA